jgi:RimJ/RimL family protein N-acetyltransferase
VRITSNAAQVVPWVSKKLFARFNTDAAIGLERGQMVAGVVYENWNGASMTCHIAVQGLLTPAYLGAIFHYPFVWCGARKIIAPVAESNAESVRFVLKLGFKEEARLLDAHPEGAIRLYTMTPDCCRYLGGKYGQKFIAAARA